MMHLQLRQLKVIIIIISIIITIITTTRNSVLACQLGNKAMSACLHRYLERDFSIVEDLLRRPPYGENGHILIEEGELEAMCAKLAELKACYEAVFGADCVAYTGYAQMKRILKIMRLVYGNFCEQAGGYRIKDLIEGGYCIEYVRKGSICGGSDNPTFPANETATISTTEVDLTPLRTISPRHRWPYTLTSMLRFEAGVDVCPYLAAFTACMTPNVELRCREESRIVWRQSSDAILQVWCGSGGNQKSRSTLLLPLLILVATLLCYYY